MQIVDDGDAVSGVRLSEILASQFSTSQARNGNF
jgi:hypothetical protein